MTEKRWEDISRCAINFAMTFLFVCFGVLLILIGLSML